MDPGDTPGLSALRSPRFPPGIRREGALTSGVKEYMMVVENSN